MYLLLYTDMVVYFVKIKISQYLTVQCPRAAQFFFKTVQKLSKMKLSGLWVSLFILFHTLSFILVV